MDRRSALINAARTDLLRLLGAEADEVGVDFRNFELADEQVRP